MIGNWLRRSLLLAAGALALVLTACGSGTIESQLHPARVVAFGDAFADVGQNGSRYTVNDGSINNWTQGVASAFGLAITPVSAGGLSYATGNARVVAKPDAAGNNSTRTVEEQVTAFLAANTLGANDLVLVHAGTSDVIVEAMRAISGAQSTDQAIANARAAGRALGAQVRRLVQAGAQHVAVAGVYNMSKSPWAISAGQTSLLDQVSAKFNEDLLVSMVDLGANVLYIDAALQFNLATGTPAAFALTEVTTQVCTSVDAGPGIGIGTGRVNSALCTTTTIVSGADYSKYMFADAVYPTPQGQRLFADYAFSRIRARW